MRKLIFIFGFFSFLFSCNAQKTLPQKLNGAYCDKVPGLIAFCLTFDGDTFHSALASMMFGYTGKGTYAIKNDSLILYYCKADSGYYVDGTTPAGTITKYKIKKATEAELIIKGTDEKDFSTLKKEKHE
ncbi:MAG: hypothetical protein HY063_00135 [Bacteroidetes bacterium]|nr:hypothetical protein [Bacteroidota bacterium]